MINFSVELGPRGTVPDYPTLKRICLEAERLGYHAFYLPNGVQWTDFECWTTLAHLAASTSIIRLGPAATFVTYHHPTLLAKTAATLDNLSGGRLDFRLGAGGASAMIDQMHGGIPLPQPEVRVEMLNEGLRLIRRLWDGGSITFRGRYFTTEDAECRPRPLQKPHPPITVCATGQRTLRLAAKQADVWESSGNLDGYRRQAKSFSRLCQEAGRKEDEIRKALEITVAVAESDLEAEAIVERYRSQRGVRRRSGYDPLEKAVVGRPYRCADAILEFVRAGVSSFTVYFIGLGDFLPLRLFAEQVVPMVKESALS